MRFSGNRILTDLHGTAKFRWTKRLRVDLWQSTEALSQLMPWSQNSLYRSGRPARVCTRVCATGEWRFELMPLRDLDLYSGLLIFLANSHFVSRLLDSIFPLNLILPRRLEYAGLYLRTG